MLFRLIVFIVTIYLVVFSTSTPLTKSNSTNTTQKKTTKSIKNQTISCPILQKIHEVSLEEKLERRRKKQAQRKLKRQMAKERLRENIHDEQDSTSTNEEVAIASVPTKKQPPPPPKVKAPIRRFLDHPHTFDVSQDPWYSAKELKVLYPWLDTAPEIAPQSKSLGEQCGYQAHYNLLHSIESIATNPDPKHKKFVDPKEIRQMMSKTVSDQLALMETGKIPLNMMKSEHLYPGDINLESFSVSAFLAMGGQMNPYRYKEMLFRGGKNCGIPWLLRQEAGYFIVCGNRLPIEDIKKKAFKDSFHYLAVNIQQRLIIDNKSSHAFVRLSQEAFDCRLKTLHSILALEKQEGNEWKHVF